LKNQFCFLLGFNYWIRGFVVLNKKGIFFSVFPQQLAGHWNITELFNDSFESKLPHLVPFVINNIFKIKYFYEKNYTVM
jgi:hypothetical protein